MNVTKLKQNQVDIGLEVPFSVLHISDTHLTFADERDSERKNILALSRSKGFSPSGEEKLNDAEKLSKEYSVPIVLFFHTPLYEKELCKYALNDSNGVAGYVVDAPEEFLKLYPHDRYIQQKADEITKETVRYKKRAAYKMYFGRTYAF